MVLIAVASTPLSWAQRPEAHSPIGFTYNLPDDWQVVMAKAAPSLLKPPANTLPEEKKGIACVEVPLTAGHGNPRSAVVVVTLPFDCFGQTMTGRDLPGFGAGVVEGLKRTLDFVDPLDATYELAGHKVWIERVMATPKAKTAPSFTLETACTLLKKGAVCWMVQAADAEDLAAFEQSQVTLEGAAAQPLVPAGVFVKGAIPAKPPK